MKTKFARISKALISSFHRWTFYSGTNTIAETKIALRHLLGFSPPSSVITEYENEFARLHQAPHAVSFANGRMALYAILKSFNLSKDDEVILPAFTCVVVPNAIIYVGAKPIYVDISLRDFNLDLSKIEEKISAKTKVLYIQHTFGIETQYFKELKKLAETYKLFIIEDSAHAMGRPLRADAAFYSSDHSKVINTSFGGMALIKDNEFYKSLRLQQNEAAELENKKLNAILRLFIFEFIFYRKHLVPLGKLLKTILNRMKFFYSFADELSLTKPTDYPLKLSAIQAKIGLLQLQRLDKNLEHRKKCFEFFESKLKVFDHFSLDQKISSTWLRYPFCVHNPEDVRKKLSSLIDPNETWFTSVVQCRNSNYEEVFYEVGSCPVAEWVSQHIINFPTHEGVALQDLEKQLEPFFDLLKKEAYHFSKN